MATSKKSLWYHGKEFRKVPGHDHRSRNRDIEVWVTKQSEFVVVRTLPLHADHNGYLSARFKERNLYAHRAVLMAWSRPPKKGEVCMHRDGNHENNRFSNLKWGTQKENQETMVRQGRSCRGEKQGGSKLTEADVLEIRRAVRSGMTCRALAKLKTVSLACIWNAATGVSWGWLPGAVKNVKQFRRQHQS